MAKALLSVQRAGKLLVRVSAAGDVRLPTPLAFGLIASLVAFTHGMPIVAGFTWWPLPYHQFFAVTRRPAFLAAADAMTFTHVDWPWRVLAQQWLAAGHLPLWNPYSSLGIPFVGQIQNQLLLPIEWIELLGGPTFWSLLLIVKLILAGFGTYSLLRRFVADDLSALAGGIVYTYCGYFLWLYTIPSFVNGAALLPWVFLAVIRSSEPQARLTTSTALVALSLGLMLLIGQPQIAVLSALGVGIFAALMLLLAPDNRCRLRAVLSLTLGGGLAMLIAGLELQVLSENLSHMYSLHRPGSYANEYRPALTYVMSTFPYLLGQLGSIWRYGLAERNPNAEAFPVIWGTFGVISLALVGSSLAGAVRRRRLGIDSRMLALVTPAALILVIVVAASVGYMAFASLPLLNRVNISRYGAPTVSLGVAALVAWALATLPVARRTTVAVVAGVYAIVAAGCAILVFPLVFGTAEQINIAEMPGSLVLGVGASALVLLAVSTILIRIGWHNLPLPRARCALIICLIGELTVHVRYGLILEAEQMRLVILLSFVTAGVLVALSRDRAAAPLVGFAAIATTALVVTGQQGLPTAFDQFGVTPPHIAFLREAVGEASIEGRVLASKETALANILSAYGIAELPSLNPFQVSTTADYILKSLSKRHLSGIVAVGWGVTPAEQAPTWADYGEQRNFYNAVGVRFLMDTPNGVLSRMSIDGVQPIYSDSWATIYEDTQALPRAYAFEAGVRQVDSEADLSALLVDPGFDPTRQALVEPDTNAQPRQLPRHLTRPTSRRARSLDAQAVGPNRVDIPLDITRDSFVVLADAYYPGWHAYVDGQPRAIYRVNRALRGVEVEAGEKVLSFLYEPDYLVPWAGVSLAALFFCLVLLVAPPCLSAWMTRRNVVAPGPSEALLTTLAH